MSNTKSSNQAAVPEAKGALDRFKFEVANELGVPLTDGYNGNLTSKQNGSVGGYMVKKIVSEQPLNFSFIFYIIPRAIVNYRTTFPGICYCLRTTIPRHITPEIIVLWPLFSAGLMIRFSDISGTGTWCSLSQSDHM